MEGMRSLGPVTVLLSDAGFFSHDSRLLTSFIAIIAVILG